MSDVVVLVQFQTQLGSRPQLLAWLAENLPDTRRQDGCKEISAYVDQEDADRVVLIQRWGTRRQQEEYAKWRYAHPSREALVPLLAAPPAVQYLDLADA